MQPTVITQSFARVPAVLGLALGLAFLLPDSAAAQSSNFFDVTSYTTGTGGTATGVLGTNGFTIATSAGANVSVNTTSNDLSAYWMNSTYNAPDPAFSGITFPFANGRADAVGVGTTSGVITINFNTPQSNLLVLVSYLDGNWAVNQPFNILPSSLNLAVDGGGNLYSTALNMSDVSTYNQGRGILSFSSPISSLTFTKVSGVADDFFVGLATASPVPEPNGAILLGVAGVLGIVRRRRLTR